MQYLGGKSRIAKQIAATILASTDDRSTYVEPFVGAGSVAVQLAPHFERSYLSDASPDLIELWRALALNWTPPDTVSPEEYAGLRNAPVSALRGFVGYGCSFGGKWFGGYARHASGCCKTPGKTYASHSAGSLVAKVKRLGSADFVCLDYRDVYVPRGAVVYCDPPYRGTTKYARLANFDSDDFWAWATRQSCHATVYVSEYAAPEGWCAVWGSQVNVSIHRDRNAGVATEHLWTYSPVRSIPLAA